MFLCCFGIEMNGILCIEVHSRVSHAQAAAAVLEYTGSA